MGLKDTEFFDSDSYESTSTQIIICEECCSHLCLSSLIISDGFTGSSGDALLVDRIINYMADPEVIQSSMRTGDYLTRVVRCKQCHTRLGWTYQKAYKPSESYKEGKFVIENRFLKMIPNNSATVELLSEAKASSRRRRSSATLSSSSSINDDAASFFSHYRHQSLSSNGSYSSDFKFSNLPLNFKSSPSTTTSSTAPTPAAAGVAAAAAAAAAASSVAIGGTTTTPRSSFNFRDLYNASASARTRLQALDKEDFDEEDEDNEVFVGV